jgi:hypothetical protein
VLAAIAASLLFSAIAYAGSANARGSA